MLCDTLLKNKKILVISRANAIQKSNEVLFQDLDGHYLDRIAPFFKEMEILVPIHIKGIHQTYDIYRNYNYQFQSPNIQILDMPGIKTYSNNFTESLKMWIRQWFLLKSKIRNTSFVYIFMASFAAVMAAKISMRFNKPFAIYSGIDWGEVAPMQYRWNYGTLKYGKLLYIKLCKYLDKWVMKNAPIKIVNNPKMFQKYIQFKGIIEEAKPLIQIKARDCLLKEDTCKSKDIKILTVATISPRKGLEYLIEGFAHAQREISSLELHIIGAVNDAKYKRKLDGIIEKEQINSKVRWHGYVPNGPKLYDYYRKSDIFVLPSISEGFPRVIWEAFSQSIPVIATNLYNIQAKLGNSEAIHLIGIKDSQAISKAIIKLLKEKSYRVRLILNGQKYLKELLRESAAEQFIRLIKSNTQLIKAK